MLTRNIVAVYISLLSVVAAVTAVAIGLSGAPAVQAQTSVDTLTVPSDVAHYFGLTTCNDSLPVFIDVATGTLYGDQDSNGVIDGSDCDWQ